MLASRPSPLPAEVEQGLNTLQANIDSIADYAQKLVRSDSLFRIRNRKADPVFSIVRERLKAASGDSNRCVYCEDSEANQVEHIAPKSFFRKRHLFGKITYGRVTFAMRPKTIALQFFRTTERSLN